MNTNNYRPHINLSKYGNDYKLSVAVRSFSSALNSMTGHDIQAPSGVSVRTASIEKNTNNGTITNNLHTASPLVISNVQSYEESVEVNIYEVDGQIEEVLGSAVAKLVDAYTSPDLNYIPHLHLRKAIGQDYELNVLLKIPSTMEVKSDPEIGTIVGGKREIVYELKSGSSSGLILYEKQITEAEVAATGETKIEVIIKDSSGDKGKAVIHHEDADEKENYL